MRTTFVNSSLVFATLSSALSNAVKRQDVCTKDVPYKGFFSNSQINYDVQTYCNSILGIPPTTLCEDHTVTTRTTVYPQATITGTVTRTTIVPGSMTTVYSTAVIPGFKKRAIEVAPAPTARAVHAPRGHGLKGRDFEDIIKRQAASTTKSSAFDVTSAIYSVCSCGSEIGDLMVPLTDYQICTTTSTVTNDVVSKATTTFFVTMTAGVSTVTETVNSTTILPTTASTSSSSKTSESTSSTPTSSTSSSTTTTTHDIGPVTTSTSSSSSSSSSSSLSSTTTTTTTTTTTETTTGTTSITSSTATPSGCPYINGTKYDHNPSPCDSYQYVCGRTYAEKDFYTAEFYYPTVEGCTEVCDAQNRGGVTACKGVVWNTTSVNNSPNCRTLRSLTSPEDDSASVALILIADRKSPGCAPNTTTTTTTTTTAQHNTTSTTHSHHPIMKPSHSHNSTTTTTMNSTTTTTTWHTTGTESPISSNSSSCVVSTITSNQTVYVTQTAYQTVTVPITNPPIISTITVTNNLTETETDTVTITEPRHHRSGPWMKW